MSAERVTLTRHILMQQQQHPGATGEFSILLSQIALAAKSISRRLRVAGLTGALGATDEINVQGEIVQQLDEISNDAFLESFAYGQLVSDMVSEEMDQPAQILGNTDRGKYVVFVDPLDGSSNIDVDVTIGSIFSIHRRPTGRGEALRKSLYLKGRDQVAAGYAVYGPNTMLVYTAGAGVHGFTLDPGIGDFFLSHGNIRVPSRGATYSINEGRRNDWLPETRHYVEYLQQRDKESGRPYSGRYVGSFVADFHRTLLKGGIFLYPADPGHGSGKLRLMYEAAPMALVIEQAGGRASNGRQPILDLVPQTLHQRTPLLIGSPEDVEQAESFYA